MLTIISATIKLAIELVIVNVSMLHLALQIFSYAEKGFMYVLTSNNKSELHNINIGWFFRKIQLPLCHTFIDSVFKIRKFALSKILFPKCL